MSLQSIVMGCNEAEFLGEGWMEREAPPESPVYRATGKQASLRLPAGEETRLSIMMRAHPARADLPFTGHFSILFKKRTNEIPEVKKTEITVPFELHFPEWCLREIELPESEVPRQLTIVCDQTWRPADFFSNQDPRNLGVLVASISCHPNTGQQD